MYLGSLKRLRVALSMTAAAHEHLGGSLIFPSFSFPFSFFLFFSFLGWIFFFNTRISIISFGVIFIFFVWFISLYDDLFFYTPLLGRYITLYFLFFSLILWRGAILSLSSSSGGQHKLCRYVFFLLFHLVQEGGILAGLESIGKIPFCCGCFLGAGQWWELLSSLSWDWEDKN
jgi:hypothetical protein